MKFRDYQDAAMETAIYPGREGEALEPSIYPALGLAGEAGEVAEHFKKMLRDDDAKLTFTRREQIMWELGDVLWYVAAICEELEVSMGDVARENIMKLKMRSEAGTLRGEGDDR